MTRTDAIIAAITAVLEEHRGLLDGTKPVRAVRLYVRIGSDNGVQGVVFNPEIESVSKQHRVDQFVFEEATQ